MSNRKNIFFSIIYENNIRMKRILVFRLITFEALISLSVHHFSFFSFFFFFSLELKLQIFSQVSSCPLPLINCFLLILK